jgi:hypothetical protein
MQDGGWHGLLDRDAEVSAVAAVVGLAPARTGGVRVVRGPAGIWQERAATGLGAVG